MTDLLIVQGHPDRSSFVAALAASYAEGAAEAGVTTRVLELAGLAFDPVLHRGYRADQPLEPDLAQALAAIRAARHVTFAFPTWWAAPPALVKGFTDRLFLPDIAFRYEAGKALPVGLFAGRSARLITTMDSPSFWYRWKHRRSLHRAFVSATLEFVGFSPIATRTFYGVRGMAAADRAHALATAQRDGRDDARRLARGPRSAAAPATRTAA